MRRVLITGSGGFVGRVLAERMTATGIEVWGADRLPEDRPAQKTRRIAVDLTDREAVAKLLDQSKPDAIVHLAAQSSARMSFDNPVGTITDNTIPVLHLLDELRRRSSVCRLLAVGSADEYGPVTSEDQLPLRETSPIDPQNPYALSKWMQTQCCRTYAALYGVDVVMTRSFNHTGAGQRIDFVLPSFAREIAGIKLGKRDPVIHVGNLDTKRDFLDVRDVCEAYIGLLEGGRRGEIYNVCSGNSYRIGDLLDRLCVLAGVYVEIKIDPSRLRPVDTLELRGDPAKIKTDTGWRPKIPIEETLRWLLTYWEQKLLVEENSRAC